MQPTSQPMLPSQPTETGPEIQLPAVPDIRGKTMPRTVEEVVEVMVGNLSNRFQYLVALYPDPAENGMLATGAVRDMYSTAGPALYARVCYELARRLDQNLLTWCIPAFFSLREECLSSGGTVAMLCMLYSTVARENNLPPAAVADAVSAETAARMLMATAGRDPGDGPISTRLCTSIPEYLGERLTELYIWRNGGYRALVGDGQSLSQRFMRIAEQHLIQVERANGRIVKAWPRDEITGPFLEAIMHEQGQGADEDEDDGEEAGEE